MNFFLYGLVLEQIMIKGGTIPKVIELNGPFHRFELIRFSVKN